MQSPTPSIDPSVLLRPMPLRPLGKTGWQASLLALGGVKWDTLLSESEAVRLIHRAIELGVNTFDTAAIYGRGQSETRLGLALRGRPERLWVQTKVTERSYDGARRQMDESFQRLGMDRVDLMFMHGIGDREEDEQWLRRPDGFFKAVNEFRAAGRFRFVGVSGHWHKEFMLNAIRDFSLDAVLLPAGIFNLAYKYSYLDEVVPLARQRGVGVMGMKVLAAGRAKHAASIEPYVRYSIHQPIDSAVIGCDTIAQLEQLVSIIKSNPAPLSDDEQKALFPEAFTVTQAFEKGEFNWVSFYRKIAP